MDALAKGFVGLGTLCLSAYTAWFVTTKQFVVEVPQPYPYPVEVRESCPPPADEGFDAYATFPDAGIAVVLMAKPIPEKPLKRQMVAPCNKKLFLTELKGSCWVETAQKYPCPELQYTDGVKCYLPAAMEEALNPPKSETPKSGGKP